MNRKNAFKNAAPAMFHGFYAGKKSLSLAHWIPVSGGDAACTGMTIFSSSLL